MTRDEIIGMAREADPEFDSDPEDMPFCLLGMDAVERFAALVAAKAAQDEREQCAKRCEEKSDYWLGQCDTTSAALQACAVSLRARGR